MNKAVDDQRAAVLRLTVWHRWPRVSRWQLFCPAPNSGRLTPCLSQTPQFRLSVVCYSFVTFVHPTQPVDNLGNVSTPFCSLAICLLLVGKEYLSRSCFLVTEEKCYSGDFQGESADICLCKGDKCNGAVMTSSVGHVIIMVSLIISVIIGCLQ